MFFEVDKKDPNAIAAVNEAGETLTYGSLVEFAGQFGEVIGHRTLIFILCKNEFGALKGYVSCLSDGIVPLMVDAGLDNELLLNLIETYKPEFLWIPEEKKVDLDYSEVFASDGYSLVKTGFPSYELYPELGLLLTTSGSTGTAKLVRQSYANVESNARAIISYLEIDENERPITNLPMSYTYGLSVINSHLLAGARIMMTTRSIFQREFWQFFKEGEITSIAGVPYTYEMLKKMRFFRMQLPSLKTMTQAGGKLSPELHKEFGEFAHENGIRFFVMYGQTEATARMSYLPYERTLEKYGSMGIAIPGGKFSIIDVDGNEITEPEVAGELVYEGPNVTLGYGTCPEDLAKGDENHGRLVTGDIAKFDSDGFYYIVGRKKRFLKIFGKRVNLDECEKLLKEKFEIECACSGRDDLLGVFVTDEQYAAPCVSFLSDKLGIHNSAFTSRVVEEIPKNESGKTLYKDLVL